MNRPTLRASLLATALLLAACGGETDTTDSTGTTVADGEGATVTDPAADTDAIGSGGFEDSAQPDGGAAADAFFAAVAQHCGGAFAGSILVDRPAVPSDDPMAGKPLVMHVRECSEDTIRIPFHVGSDRSRTWVLTRTADGLRLKHDHRHEDGTPDAVTMYGGDTTTPGTAQRQEFPVDADSIALFEGEGLDASVTNVWAIEIEPRERFLYELSRPGGRLFQVEFDLGRPVQLPPAPWGSE